MFNRIKLGMMKEMILNMILNNYSRIYKLQSQQIKESLKNFHFNYRNKYKFNLKVMIVILF